MATHASHAFVCPTCSAAGRPVLLEVVATRHPCRGVTRRYRSCRSCGFTTRTEERQVVVDTGSVAVCVGGPTDGQPAPAA
jgi:hypothetical protein